MPYTTIKKPSDYFNTVLYTGNGSTNNITGVNFQPDLVWIKSRSVIRDHVLTDSVRGIASQIHSNTTDAESTFTNDVTSFDSDGFTVSTDSDVNGSTFTYASWNWLASNTTTSNTDGSITSTVSANTTSGFSIVSYTGNGTAGATVGHGLGTTPSMTIIKSRDNGTLDWGVYHKSIGNTGAIYLDLTNATDTSAGFWNNTSPNSSVFTLGSGGTTNSTGDNFIAYCFAEKQGFSKFGSYTGNGSTDGTFVYTGFKPAFVLVKNTAAITSWQLIDNKRSDAGGNNIIDKVLAPNASDAEYDEGSSAWCGDVLSNGFKWRGNWGALNGSGQTHIYMAFAEEPLVGDNPATAR